MYDSLQYIDVDVTDILGIEPRTRLMICGVWELFSCQVQYGDGVVCVCVCHMYCERMSSQLNF